MTINNATETCGKTAESVLPPKNPKIADGLATRKRSRAIFYSLWVAVPVIQFCIFYIYVNFNSFLLAFQSYALPEGGSSGFLITFAGFANFKIAWDTFMGSGGMIVNSLRLYACNLFLVLPLALLFSFYLYKQYPCSGLFKVVLFMPKVISDLVLAVLFKYIANDGYMKVVELITGTLPQYGLMDNPATEVGMVLFYNIWVGFGVNVLLYSGAMSGINESLVEASKLDGANVMQEFIYLTVPLIFQTISTFIVLGIAGIFTNNMHLLSLKGSSAGELSTMGYFNESYLRGINRAVIYHFETSRRPAFYPAI